MQVLYFKNPYNILFWGHIANQHLHIYMEMNTECLLNKQTIIMVHAKHQKKGYHLKFYWVSINHEDHILILVTCSPLNKLITFLFTYSLMYAYVTRKVQLPYIFEDPTMERKEEK